MTKKFITRLYNTYLEEDIIFCLSEHYNTDLATAMKIFYCSETAKKINDKNPDIQNLNYSDLAKCVIDELK